MAIVAVSINVALPAGVNTAMAVLPYGTRTFYLKYAWLTLVAALGAGDNVNLNSTTYSTFGVLTVGDTGWRQTWMGRGLAFAGNDTLKALSSGAAATILGVLVADVV